MSDIKNSKDMEEQNQNTKYLQNKEYVENKFKDWGDIVKREFPVGEKREVKVYIVYVDDMVNRTMLEEEIIKNLIVNIRISNPVIAPFVPMLWIKLIPINVIPPANSKHPISPASLRGAVEKDKIPSKA